MLVLPESDCRFNQYQCIMDLRDAEIAVFVETSPLNVVEHMFYSEAAKTFMVTDG